MTPESILSYYPSYAILDEIFTTGQYVQANIFIDLNNNLQTLYLPQTILALTETTKRSKYIDTSIFNSVLSFLAFHKKYFQKRGNINVNFYFFFETGGSFYHTNISKKYKISRKTDNLYGLDKTTRDLFFSIKQKNFLLIEKVLNTAPGCNLFKLQNFEADFVPYYLVKNKLIKHGSNVVNVLYSNDHDMLQCLNLDETFFIYSKTKTGKKVIRKGNAFKEYFKCEKSFPDEYFTLAMSIIGDAGDDVDGVEGIGQKRIDLCLSKVAEMVGGMDKLRDNVMSNKPIFATPDTMDNKYIEKIVEFENKFKTISNNMRLVDFDIISRYFMNPDSTEIISKRNLLHETLNQNKITPIEVLKPALEMNGVALSDELEIIYNII